MDNEKARDNIIERSGVNVRKCMRCGKCSATCPSYDKMEYHPHEFVNMIEIGDIEPLLKSESIFTCLSCMACVDRCPRGVEPGKLIEAVRLEVTRQKGGDGITPDDIPALLDDEVPQQAIVSAFRKLRKS